jgi:hypothetical protein
MTSFEGRGRGERAVSSYDAALAISRPSAPASFHGHLREWRSYIFQSIWTALKPNFIIYAFKSVYIPPLYYYYYE